MEMDLYAGVGGNICGEEMVWSSYGENKFWSIKKLFFEEVFNLSTKSGDHKNFVLYDWFPNL